MESLLYLLQAMGLQEESESLQTKLIEMTDSISLAVKADEARTVCMDLLHPISLSFNDNKGIIHPLLLTER